MRATGWVRKETAAARRATVRATAQATYSREQNHYGVTLRFIIDGQPSRLGERLVIMATLEETRELIVELTQSVADCEHGNESLTHTRKPRGVLNYAG